MRVYIHIYIYIHIMGVCIYVCSMFMYMPMYPMWMRWGSAAILFTGELRGRGLLPAAGVNRGGSREAQRNMGIGCEMYHVYMTE